MKKQKGFTQHYLLGQKRNIASSFKKSAGFTLIELLIVIAIIAVLAAIIYVAVDPVRRMAEARNASRWSSVNAILNAYLKYTVDNTAEPVTLASGDYYMIGEGPSGCTGNCGAQTVSACIDLSPLVDRYLAQIPGDPKSAVDNNTNKIWDKTDYYIMRSDNGRITVGACVPEKVGDDTKEIEVSR
jgi:type IV pilus assembly protein PilA